jgi:hypothetical protein
LREVIRKEAAAGWIKESAREGMHTKNVKAV